MQTYQPELVLSTGAILAEGPAWDESIARLLWVDIPDKKLHVFDPASGVDESIDVGQHIGAAVPHASGGVVVALERGFYHVNLSTRTLAPIALVDHPEPDLRFNDGKVDPAGRFWAGSMAMTERADAGALYCLDTDSRVRKVLAPVTVSNGMAWSLDHRTMFYIDSPTRKVMAFAYDLATGTLGLGKVVLEIPDGEGVPDGMTIDAQGMIWVAQWDGWQVSRWNPATGERLARIPLPAARVTSCAFCGANLDELYITTARINLSDAEQAQQPLAGSLFRVKPGVQGLPTARFGQAAVQPF